MSPDMTGQQLYLAMHFMKNYLKNLFTKKDKENLSKIIKEYDGIIKNKKVDNNISLMYLAVELHDFITDVMSSYKMMFSQIKVVKYDERNG